MSVSRRNYDVELGVNSERRRAGEVSLSVLSDGPLPGFAWVSVDEARDFAFKILAACRESEDMVR